MLDSRQHRRIGPLQNQAHFPFGGAAAAALFGNPHQNAIAIPGRVEMTLTNVNVLGILIILDCKTESFAGAAQLARHHVILLDAAVTTPLFDENSNLFQRIQRNLQLPETLLVFAVQFLF